MEVTGASALIKKDFASSVFDERSPRDLGLEGGLGGLSMARDDSSAEDNKTLVRDEPTLSFLSMRGELMVLLRRLLDPLLLPPIERSFEDFSLASSFSLLEQLDELDSELLSELEDVPEEPMLCFRRTGEPERLFDLRHIAKRETLGNMDLVVSLADFFEDSDRLSLILNFPDERDDFKEPEDEPCDTIGPFDSEFISESWELAEILL